MNEIVLINEKLLKQYSPITDNTDVTEFVPYISIAQKLYINEILGVALLSELEDQIKNNTLTPENGDLILKIAPPLAMWTVYQGLPFHWSKISNKGITSLESENSNATTLKDVGQLRQWLKDDAQLLTQQLIDFLCECKENYPLWMPDIDCKCKCEDKNGTGSNKMKYNSGITFL
ncbi:hypothetical protein, partial [Dysgonomonas sp. 520]|uniref:DUF6712 family protein n=1 Tax=Dysgonomonas sp. 520 TaxID=2302931 RepID=UPI001628AD06